MTALQKLIDDFTRDYVFARFKQEGELGSPVWMIETVDAQRIMVVAPLEEGTDKDMLAVIVRQLIKQHNGCRAVMASETWFASYKSIDEVNNAPPPSKQADRKEGVMIVGEDRDGETRSFVCEIDRSDKLVTLKPMKRMDLSFGRWTNMFEGKSQ
jgi:hypothetical protein